nr:hypothetical protein [Ktedonobacteraceae bacterium]
MSNTQKRQHKRVFLSLAVGLGGICVILIATIVGATVLRPQPSGAHAADVSDGQPMSMNEQNMHASMVPIRFMYDRAVTVNAQNAGQTMNAMTCLTNTQRPLCY